MLNFPLTVARCGVCSQQVQTFVFLAFAINLRTICVHDIYFVGTKYVENEMEMRVRRWVVEKDRREAGRSF